MNTVTLDMEQYTSEYRYKMRLVYAHFPINANAEKGGSELSIRNFLGEKIVRVIPMCEGVKCTKDTEVKDQILFEGNSIENVSRCAPSFLRVRVHELKATYQDV
jgi:large subunit ribosomal protein L9e